MYVFFSCSDKHPLGRQTKCESILTGLNWEMLWVKGIWLSLERFSWLFSCILSNKIGFKHRDTLFTEVTIMAEFWHKFHNSIWFWLTSFRFDFWFDSVLFILDIYPVQYMPNFLKEKLNLSNECCKIYTRVWYSLLLKGKIHHHSPSFIYKCLNYTQWSF